MRILRVFKLVRHFAGLQSLVHTLHQVILSFFVEIRRSQADICFLCKHGS